MSQPRFLTGTHTNISRVHALQFLLLHLDKPQVLLCHSEQIRNHPVTEKLPMDHNSSP